MAKVTDVIAAMERIAPPFLAVDGDPIGLHAGSPGGRVRRVALALDAGYGAVAAAEKMGADMLVVHHPRFYRGLPGVAETDAAGRRGAALARSGLAVYSAHTNLDVAPGGINDLLAEMAGLEEPRVVAPVREERLLKLTVFVPAEQVEKVRRAVCAAGAGAVGQYGECTFRVRGTGTFRCGEETRPFQGEPGSFEQADEFRLETVVWEYSLGRVVEAMIRAHPYEEVAYDVHPLLGRSRWYGFGRVGTLSRPGRLAELAARFAAASGSTMAQWSGGSRAKIRRFAVWAGAGVDVGRVIGSGAEALLAGEVGYHDLETFLDAGVGVITLGHGFCEEIVLRPLALGLANLLPEVDFQIAGRGFIAMRNVPPGTPRRGRE